MTGWMVECEPEGKNDDGVNEGGMIVWLVKDGEREEVSTVGFIRRNSANPDIEFEQALEAEVAKAKVAARIKNELDELRANAGARL